MTSRILSGKEFNEKYTGVRFVKLTNEEENHNDYQFKDGLNIDTVPFYTKLNCYAGGIYFCKFNNFVNWISYGSKIMYYMRNVIIPDDALVFEESNGKYKSNKIILSEKSIIFEVKEIYLEAIRQNRQKKQVCLSIVRQNGLALQYIEKQTKFIYFVCPIWLNLTLSNLSLSSFLQHL